jgi:hypothetical protein
MTQIFNKVAVFPSLFYMVFIIIALLSMITQSAASHQLAKCDELKKDITEMKEDLDGYNNNYNKGGPIDSEDKTDLLTDASDFRDDFNKYLKDPQSDPMEIAKAEEGLKLVSQMEDGITNNNIDMVLSSYTKIIKLYEWFYQYEDCRQEQTF